MLSHKCFRHYIFACLPAIGIHRYLESPMAILCQLQVDTACLNPIREECLVGMSIELGIKLCGLESQDCANFLVYTFGICVS